MHPHPAVVAEGTARCDPPRQRPSARWQLLRRRLAKARILAVPAASLPLAMLPLPRGTSAMTGRRRTSSAFGAQTRRTATRGATVHPHTALTAEGTARCDPHRRRFSARRHYLLKRLTQARSLKVYAASPPAAIPPLPECASAMTGHRRLSSALVVKTRSTATRAATVHSHAALAAGGAARRDPSRLRLPQIHR